MAIPPLTSRCSVNTPTSSWLSKTASSPMSTPPSIHDGAARLRRHVPKAARDLGSSEEAGLGPRRGSKHPMVDTPTEGPPMTATEVERPQRQGQRVLLSGVEALAQLLVARRQLDLRQGRDTATFVSGYPGSPLGGFDFAVDRLGGDLERNRILHQPGLNEELAATAVWGSQMGVRSEEHTSELQ